MEDSSVQTTTDSTENENEELSSNPISENKPVTQPINRKRTSSEVELEEPPIPKKKCKKIKKKKALLMDVFGDTTEIQLKLTELRRNQPFLKAHNFHSLLLYILADSGFMIAPKWIFVKNKSLIKKIIVIQIDNLTDANRQSILSTDTATNSESKFPFFESDNQCPMVLDRLPKFPPNSQFAAFRKLTVIHLNWIKGIDRTLFGFEKKKKRKNNEASHNSNVANSRMNDNRNNNESSSIDNKTKVRWANAPAVVQTFAHKFTASSNRESSPQQSKPNGSGDKPVTAELLLPSMDVLIKNEFPIEGMEQFKDFRTFPKLNSKNETVSNAETTSQATESTLDDAKENNSKDTPSDAMAVDGSKENSANGTVSNTIAKDGSKVEIANNTISNATKDDDYKESNANGAVSDAMAKDDSKVDSANNTISNAMKDDDCKENNANSMTDGNGYLPMVAIDCEMVRTEFGLELARISLVDSNAETIYDELVKPSNPIIDYCTQWSGITAEILKDVSKTLDEVYIDLCKYINSQTYIVGHGLENDFYAMRVIHYRVLDTALLFGGNGHKLKLRVLTKRFLHYEIQQSKDGHCSTEDAIAALKLVKLKMQKGLNFGNNGALNRDNPKISVFNALSKLQRASYLFGPKQLFIPLKRCALSMVETSSDSESFQKCHKKMNDDKTHLLWLYLRELKQNTTADKFETLAQQLKQLYDIASSNTVFIVVSGTKDISQINKLQQEKIQMERDGIENENNPIIGDLQNAEYLLKQYPFWIFVKPT